MTPPVDEMPRRDPPRDPYRLLIDAPPVARVAERMAGGMSLSLAAHVICLIVVMFVVSREPLGPAPDVRSPFATRMVFTAEAPAPKGPGGGGGGGEADSDRSRRAQLVGREAIARPAAPPANIESADSHADPPAIRVALPDPQISAGLTEMIGAISDVRPLDGGRGPGSGSGADGGRGPGINGGQGGGVGDGTLQGSGDEGVLPGNGVSWPRLLQEVKPNYTADAMRARVEGMVELEIVVLPDGAVGRVRVTRSLDRAFGLDEEAIKAVRMWRFDPARHLGRPVAARVGVELSFRLR
jgi:protein TonB